MSRSSNPYYGYSPIIHRRPLRWPNGGRVAVLITVNLETWEFIPRGDGGPPIIGSDMLPRDVPDVPNFTWREYGHRVGIFRLAKVLDGLGLRASVALNSLAGMRYPAIMEELRRRSWEFIAHCNRQDDVVSLIGSEYEEREYLRGVLDSFKTAVGSASEGWLSTGERSSIHTPRLLAELGVKHLSDYQNDDQPYFLDVGDASGTEGQDGRRRKRMLSIPYGSEINDYRCIRSGLAHTAFGELIRDEFDVLYEEGSESARLMNIGLHPHVSGRAHRSKVLAESLKYIAGHERVWFTTRGEIYDWFLRNFGDRE